MVEPCLNYCSHSGGSLIGQGSGCMTTTNTTTKATELPEKRSLTIDCDADPFIPKRWSVVRHIKGGRLDWNNELNRKADRRTSEERFHRGSEAGAFFNANVLDWLLKPENQDLIPIDWKQDESGYGRTIVFWGTIYRNEGENRCVRVLFYSKKTREWDWNYVWLGSE